MWANLVGGDQQEDISYSLTKYRQTIFGNLPELGEQMVDHNKHLQLGKFIAWAGVLSTTKWHICIRFWCNLHAHTKSENKNLKKREEIPWSQTFNHHVYSYLESCRIKFMRIAEIFWIVMNVPEQRHHLPTFRNQVPCHKVRF